MVGASYALCGLKSSELDLGTGYEPMIQKLLAKRYDYFVEELEVISGYKISGKDYLANLEIRHGAVSGAQAPSKHLLTAISGQKASMIPAINKAITSVIDLGQAAQAWKKHTGAELRYLP
jgi:hypothetical protein